MPITATDEIRFRAERKRASRAGNVLWHGVGTVRARQWPFLIKNNFRIYEVGVSYAGRSYADGKKIGWKDGLAAIWAIIKYALS